MDAAVQPDLVFDVGAHKGEDSDFYLRLGYRVLAVEANPFLAANLRQRFAEDMEAGRYVLVDKAIGDGEGDITFFVNNKVSVWGTADPTWAKRNEGLGADSEEIKVKCVRFADIVAEYGCPYYVKIDVEGADMMCVNALVDLSCRPKHISIESTKTSWFDLLNEFRVLEALGYTKFRVVDQTKHRNGTFVGRDNRPFDYRFEKGASGPFGENLDTPWLTKAQAIRKYVPIFLAYKTIGDNTVLSKLLDGVPVLRRVLELVSWYDTHATRD